MEAIAQNVDLRVQSALAAQLALKSAGIIEHGVRETLTRYAEVRGNDQLKRYIYSAVSYENSLNCRKIQSLLDRWDSGWWASISIDATDAEQSAVDSLKGIRDRVAHGDEPGAGFVTVKNYHQLAKVFITKVGNIILPTS